MLFTLRGVGSVNISHPRCVIQSCQLQPHLQLFHLSVALEVLRVDFDIELQIHTLILATRKVDARCPLSVRRLARLPQKQTPHLHSQPLLRLEGFPNSLI